MASGDGFLQLRKGWSRINAREARSKRARKN
jgi:hypothetical protein